MPKENVAKACRAYGPMYSQTSLLEEMDVSFTPHLSLLPGETPSVSTGFWSGVYSYNAIDLCVGRYSVRTSGGLPAVLTGFYSFAQCVQANALTFLVTVYAVIFMICRFENTPRNVKENSQTFFRVYSLKICGGKQQWTQRTLQLAMRFKNKPVIWVVSSLEGCAENSHGLRVSQRIGSGLYLLTILLLSGRNLKPLLLCCLTPISRPTRYLNCSSTS
jgi:hypothetical protein